MTPDRDLCARCGNQFSPGQVCDACRAGAGTKRLAVFGGVDGLTMFLGLTLGLVVSRQDSSAVWHAALGGAAGELVGMTTGQHLSDPESGWPVALACGLAGAVACLSPAWPFLIWHRTAALGASLALAAVVAGMIAWLRPERGLAAIVRTYGILIAAGVLSGLTGLALSWQQQRRRKHRLPGSDPDEESCPIRPETSPRTRLMSYGCCALRSPPCAASWHLSCRPAWSPSSRRRLPCRGTSGCPG